MDLMKLPLMKLNKVFKKSIPDQNKLHEYLVKIIKEFDINDDGKISFPEFCRVMKRMLKDNSQ